jgi:hypothetical protein
MRIESGNRGYSLTEVVISLLLTMLVMISVFLLLQRNPRSFARELPPLSEKNEGARAGLERIRQDLAVAGFSTPSGLAVMWSDGGGFEPDGISVVYADPEVPLSRPAPCAPGGPCATIGTSAEVTVTPFGSPRPGPHLAQIYERAYREGRGLFAIQGANGDPACDTVRPGLSRLDLAAPPACAGPLGGCGSVSLTLGPASSLGELGLPAGFDADASLGCAVIGLFHVVQYRVSSAPSSTSTRLERRDAALGDSWSLVAEGVSNLQVQYAQGESESFEDVPALVPVGADPTSWVTRVRVTLGGRRQTAAEGAPRRAYTTTVSLRNVQAGMKALDR